MADVFISYSRKDQPFAERFVHTLQQRGRDAWVDWEGIAPSAEWMKEIHAAIEGASAFVVIASPDWMGSRVCAQELAHAVACNKRIVAVVAHDFDAGAAPPALARLNWIFLRDGDDPEAGFAAVITALETDFEWVAEHTRMLVRASEWQSRAHDRSRLLRGADLDAAENWLVQAGLGGRPEATAQQREYLLASRRDATRRRNALTAGLGSLALAAVVAAVFALINARQARTEAAAALARQLAAQSNLVRAERADLLPRALLLATEAALRSPSPSLEADQALRALLATMPRHLAMLATGASGTRTLALSPDGMHAAWSAGDALQLARVGTAPPKTLAGQGRIDLLSFDPRGEVLLAVHERQHAALHAIDGRLRQRFSLGGESIAAAAASPRGDHVALVGENARLMLFRADGTPAGSFPVDVYQAGDPHVLVRFSADGRLLAVSSVRGVRLCPVVSPQACEVPIEATLSDRTALVFSADGRWLAVDAVTQRISVFDTASGAPVTQAAITSPGGSAWLKFSGDGRWLVVAGSSSAKVQVWDTGTWALAASFDLPSTVVSLDVAADGSRAAIGGADGTTDVRSLPDGRRLAQLAQSGPVALSADGRRVLSAGDGSSLQLWEAEAHADWARLPAVDGDNFGFDAQGAMLVAAAADQPGPAALARWSMADGRVQQAPAHTPASAAWGLAGQALRSVMLSQAHRTAWAARGDTAVAWDSASLRELFSAEHHPPVDWSTRLRPLQQRACAYRDTPCNDRIAAQQTEGSVRIAAVSADGRFAATSRADDLLRIWQIGVDQPLLALPQVDLVALTAQAAVLAPVLRDAFGRRQGQATELRVHALPGGAETTRLAQPGGLREAVLAPDGAHLLLLSNGYVQTMLALPGGQQRWQRPGSTWPLRWRFSPDGKRLAITQPDAKGRPEAVVVIETDSGKPLGPPIPTPDSALVLALSPDARWLARGSHRDVVVHQVSDGRELARVQHAATVVDLVFGHDGQMLASASEDGSVRLVDLRLGREIARLTPGGTPRRLAFSPDDALLAVAGGGGVQAFAWRSADLAREACTRLPGDQPPEVWRLYLGDSPPMACRSTAAGAGR